MVEKRTVLFVDDDTIVLQSLKRGLLGESYKKLFAKGPKEALKMILQEKVHVIITDMCMIEMTGLELIRFARKENPNIIGIILSGYEPDTELQIAVEQEEIFSLIPKPWNAGVVDFERLIWRAIDKYNLQNQRELGQFVTKGDSDD